MSGSRIARWHDAYSASETSKRTVSVSRLSTFSQRHSAETLLLEMAVATPATTGIPNSSKRSRSNSPRSEWCFRFLIGTETYRILLRQSLLLRRPGIAKRKQVMLRFAATGLESPCADLLKRPASRVIHRDHPRPGVVLNRILRNVKLRNLAFRPKVDIFHAEAPDLYPGCRGVNRNQRDPVGERRAWAGFTLIPTMTFVRA